MDGKKWVTSGTGAFRIEWDHSPNAKEELVYLRLFPMGAIAGHLQMPLSDDEATKIAMGLLEMVKINEGGRWCTTR